jgi:nitrite reductase (NADH) large subunit
MESQHKHTSRKPTPRQPLAANPIVIVGNGPVGVQAARLLLKASRHVVLYGDEEIAPYNRVKLSSVLAGQQSWDTLESDLSERHNARLQRRYGYAVTAIDLKNNSVADHQGNIQTYSKLILATGSKARIPAINGHDKPGVFTLRNRKDLNALAARQIGSRHTVVVGGGLLGLEIARAMGRWHAEVTVVGHASRVLNHQIDDFCGALIAHHIQQQGINLILKEEVIEIAGDTRVEYIKLGSGREIPCDTVIFATGIIPNIELARNAGISVNRGIQVNDQMQTSSPDVYAMGECCEHRAQIYGLVAPGLEQAGVAVHHILHGESCYQGSMSTARLKVLDEHLISIGPMGDQTPAVSVQNTIFHDPANGVYRKLSIHRNRLIGVLALGEWREAVRVQTHAFEQQPVYPWQLVRFQLTGSLWPQQTSQSTADWPANATICQCAGINRGQISTAIQQGASDHTAIANATGASTACGSCKPLIAELLGNDAPATKEANAGFLAVSALLAFIASLLFLSPIELPYQHSVQTVFQWDWIWRDNLMKQITGYSVLGLSIASLLLSLRKRWSRLTNLGAFNLWRLAHLMLGIITLTALLAHTGLRMGSGLNFWLTFCFIGLMILGAANSGIIARQHHLTGGTGRRIRAISLSWHIYLLWPLPVLLGFHIISSYWF